MEHVNRIYSYTTQKNDDITIFTYRKNPLSYKAAWPLCLYEAIVTFFIVIQPDIMQQIVPRRMMTITNASLWMAIILLFTSCAQSPEKNIVNRWRFKEVVGSERKFGRNGFLSPNGELEFQKDGNVNVYNDGNLTFSTPYTLADDGQTLIITADAASGTLIPFKILEIGKKEMKLAINFYREGITGKLDTVVFTAQ